MAEIARHDGAAIEVRSLTKAYGDVHAVRGIDVLVERGQIFALLGPNGAGKTTTVDHRHLRPGPRTAPASRSVSPC